MFAGIVSGTETVPDAQATVSGSPVTVVEDVRLQLVAPVTVADSVTAPPVLGSDEELLVKPEIVGFPVGADAAAAPLAAGNPRVTTATTANPMELRIHRLIYIARRPSSSKSLVDTRLGKHNTDMSVDSPP